jgi:hypothetical protein
MHRRQAKGRRNKGGDEEGRALCLSHLGWPPQGDGSAAIARVADVPDQRLQVAMGVQGSCHCGSVRIELPGKPAWVADCNCSLCRRLAWRVAYFPPDQVRISGETTAYVWGDRMIGIHHCPICGCGTHWQTLGEDFGKMGINARLLDDFDESAVEIRKFDNAD